ncbi:hypothetical protein QBC34DRAFT_438695 [Podospora aff. communis PSN243]|uniref:Uncharacterized protein n=1 Tax=Podospora aff. communis PSN243 TaxID=3040156 RepID=A0AAV9GL34_9PEZI|nr:hypothetical protein QBC34DRAFT_438695 [Podospora aff. communis PSN243]
MQLLRTSAILAALNAAGSAFALPQGHNAESPATLGPAPVATSSSGLARVLPGVLADQVQVVVFAFGSCMTDAARITYSLFRGSSGCVAVTNRGSINYVPSTVAGS